MVLAGWFCNLGECEFGVWSEKSESYEVKKFGTDRRMAEFVHVFWRSGARNLFFEI